MATCSLALQVSIFSFVILLLGICFIIFFLTMLRDFLIKVLYAFFEYLMFENLKSIIILESYIKSLCRQLLAKMCKYLSVVLCGVQMGILWVCAFQNE